MATETLPPQTVRTTLGYHLEVARGGAEVWCPGTVRDKRRPHEHVDVDVENIRGREKEFSLDKQGFHVSPFNTSINDLEDDQAFRGKYYEEAAEHVKQVTGATFVLPVTHICRRAQYDSLVEAEKDLPDDAPVLAPSSNRSVHIDQSTRGAHLVRDGKLETLPADRAEKLKNVRWAIVNLWRPFSTVNRDPLALCDARTSNENDLAAVYAELPESLRNAGRGYNFTTKTAVEAWEVKANPGHRWYYAANMTPKEALLIKQYDSKLTGVSRRTPHCAFSTKDDFGPTRQSIEVRCLVFWEDQPLE